MANKLPQSEGEARGQGLFMAIVSHTFSAMALCGSATCLGLPEWTECFCRQNSRFASILTDEEAEKLSAATYTPKNTVGATNGLSKTMRSDGNGVMSNAPRTKLLY